MRACARRLLSGSAALLLTAGVWGCAILDLDTSEPVQRTAFLKPIPKPRNAIDLEVYGTRRPVGDPDLGAGLWKNLQEIGAIDMAARKRLREHGFRVGQVGSMPPASLNRLIGISSQADRAAVKPLQISVS